MYKCCNQTITENFAESTNMLTGGILSSPNWIIFQKHFRRKGGGVTSDLKNHCNFLDSKLKFWSSFGQNWSYLVISLKKFS